MIVMVAAAAAAAVGADSLITKHHTNIMVVARGVPPGPAFINPLQNKQTTPYGLDRGVPPGHYWANNVLGGLLVRKH